MLHLTSKAKSCIATLGRNDNQQDKHGNKQNNFADPEQDIYYFLHSIAKAIVARPHRIAESSGTARYSLNSSR